MKHSAAVYALDIETTPFAHGNRPVPIAVGIMSENNYVDFFGHGDCVRRAKEWLKTQPAGKIYAHNGGRFDFHFFMKEWENPVNIIEGRAVSVKFAQHTLHDSYAFLPVPLAEVAKGKINYEKMNLDIYRYYEKEIRRYLQLDCAVLYTTVQAFRQRYGDRLTIGAAAFADLKEREDFAPVTNSRHDERIRPFYHGGRCEVFAARGVHKGDFALYDVNSLYPYVMANCQHPAGEEYLIFANGNKIPALLRQKTPFFFAGVVRDNSRFGMLPRVPQNENETRVDYAGQGANFYTLCTSHELAAGWRHIEILKTEKIYAPKSTRNFANFVNHHRREKIRAEKENAPLRRLFTKLILNSAAGKFGQNPENFRQYSIAAAPPPGEWSLFYSIAPGKKIFYRQPAIPIYNDVAIAASITGAARAILASALQRTPVPLYCDTDSILAQGRFPARQHPTKFGHWKTECTGNKLAIAGKKFYAIFDGKKEVKTVSKGVRMSAKDIAEIAQGETKIIKENTPRLRRGGFVYRTVKI